MSARFFGECDFSVTDSRELARYKTTRDCKVWEVFREIVFYSRQRMRFRRRCDRSDRGFR
jgi:hypothetical protein